MATVRKDYLNIIRGNLTLSPTSEREIISEPQAHIGDRFEELNRAVLSEEGTAETRIGPLASIKLVANRLYETYSQGVWR